VPSAGDAATVFQAHRDELGFVTTARCEAKDLITTTRNGETVAALLGNHCVRKPQSTVYELAVLPEYRRQGIASELVGQFVADSPHDRLVAKCPVDLPATEFYESTGWERVATENGKRRQLAVYEYQV